jgi:hypothetical protein
MDFSLNDKCLEDNGKCECDVGCKGAYCSMIDLLPAHKAKMGLQVSEIVTTAEESANALGFNSTSSWDGIRSTKPQYTFTLAQVVRQATASAPAMVGAGSSS